MDIKPAVERSRAAIGDHNYDRSDEPPAFIIQQINLSHLNTRLPQPYVEVTPLALGGFSPAVNVLHLPEARVSSQEPQPQECIINKRIRRSEHVLRQAADCISRGMTFQKVSEKFNIPISTIRFFMSRKGILPKRRRGRLGQIEATTRPTSPQPPFHMQHYKLPNMIAMHRDNEEEVAQT